MGFDGSSITGFNAIEESDMVAIPDPTTYRLMPTRAGERGQQAGDRFLVITPGITIRDRLRVLLPNDPGNYYAERDLVTPDQLRALNQAKIEITNYHAFIRRETIQAASLTKKILVGRDGDPDRFKETAGQMVRRVAGACREQAQCHRSQRRGPSLLPGQPDPRGRGRGRRGP